MNERISAWSVHVNLGQKEMLLETLVSIFYSRKGHMAADTCNQRIRDLCNIGYRWNLLICIPTNAIKKALKEIHVVIDVELLMHFSSLTGSSIFYLFDS